MVSIRWTRRGVAMTVMASILLVSVGCRSATTDRIRVLEAKNANAEKDVAELRQRNAELRAKELEAQSARERAEAESRAAEARALIAARNAPTPDAAPKVPAGMSVDTSGLRDIPGVQVRNGANGDATIILASDVTFKAGRADLSAPSQATLTKVATALRSAKGVNEVRIDGHTDSDPIRKSGFRDNHHLSVERANTVRRFLVTLGVDEGLVQVDGHGSENPVAPNTSAAGKAQNRRVEITLRGQR